MKKGSQINIREASRVYGIFIGIVVFFILVMIGMIVASRGSWKNGLRDEVQTVLEEKFPGKWKTGDFISQNIPFAYSSAVYKISSIDKPFSCRAVIIRMNTLYGPVPGVFIFDKNQGTEFAGFAGIHGRIQKILEDSSLSVRIEYWKNRVNEIMTKAGEADEQ